MPRSPVVLLGAVSMALAMGAAPMDGGTPTLPHRRSQMVVDGLLGDWEARALVVRFSEPAPGDRSPAHVTARLCWDRTTLWAAFEVVDPHVHVAPPDVSGPALFQWDSVELYLDGHGDRAPRMGPDDFQVIVTADGRTSVLEGDPLLADVEPMSVPKRERDGVAIPTAARRTPTGYVVEMALPWAAFGLEPAAGSRIALDLAVNDWDADHGGLPMYRYDLETLAAFADKPADTTGEFDLHGLSGAAADRFAQAHYHPWSWSGSPDFGHPGTWAVVDLTGSPTLLERLVDRVGVAGLLLRLGSLGLLTVGLAMGALEVRHRRTVAALITKLEGSRPDIASRGEGEEAEPPTAFADRRPTGPTPVETLEERIDAAAECGRPAGPPPELAVRAVHLAASRVAEPLSPAELAEELCVSLRTLQRELASRLRCTPRELIIAVKMREAKSLLSAGWRVQEVAGRVGYDDASHFSRRFKAYVGVPPSELGASAHSKSSAA